MRVCVSLNLRVLLIMFIKEGKNTDIQDNLTGLSTACDAVQVQILEIQMTKHF